MPTEPTDPRLEKVKALLRLAEAEGASDDERKLALDRAIAMAEKYQIDLTKLDAHGRQYLREDIVTHVFDYPTSHGLNTTRGHGIFDVIQAMGGNGYARNVSHGKGTREELVAYATESTMNILKVLIPSLILQETNANLQFIKKLKTEDPDFLRFQRVIRTMRDSKADPKDFVKHLNSTIRIHRKSFCLAFFAEAAERIRTKRKDAVQEGGRGYAVVLVDAADRIEQMLAEIPNLREKRSRGKWSDLGWEQGSVAGSQAMVGQTEVHGGRRALEC